jgi:hypothetical protein
LYRYTAAVPASAFAALVPLLVADDAEVGGLYKLNSVYYPQLEKATGLNP